MKRNIFCRLLAFILVANLSLAIVPQANAATNISASDVVSTANSLVGKYPKYVWGGYSPANGGFDCTGLIYYVYHTCLGYSMTLEQARSKSQILELGTKISDKSALLPGDIVQYTIAHVGIYIGNNTVIHSGTNWGVSKISINASDLTFSYGIRLANVVQSGSTSSTPNITTQYFNCNVKIACISGQTVNLYNNPGDSSRVAYFNKGQTALSTYGATRGDGSTWYRVTVNDNGSAKMLWLKYESSKMTVQEKAITYTVTFNANGGSVSPSSQLVNSGSTYGALPTPDRTGYNFAGWYTSADGGSQVISSSIFSGSANVTLYAHWTSAPTETYVIITFDANGGSVSPATKTVTKGSEVGSMPTPIRQGYTFIGWELENSNLMLLRGDEIVVDKDITLYAYWRPEATDQPTTYTVYFDANGGNVAQSSKTVTPSSSYGTLPTPSRSNYTFDGWYTSTSGGSQVTSNTIFNSSSNITLYAHWTKVETGHWGPWSEWSNTPYQASSIREVETRQVKISDAHTEYRYGRYIDNTGRNICWCGKYLESLSYVTGSATLQYSSWTSNKFSPNGKAWTCGYCKGNHIGVDHYDSAGRPAWLQYVSPNGDSYYWEESRWVDATYETQYRYRDWIVD